MTDLRHAIQALYNRVENAVRDEQRRSTLLEPLAEALRIVDQALIIARPATSPDAPGGSGGNPSRSRAVNFVKHFLTLNQPAAGDRNYAQALRFASAANDILAILARQQQPVALH